MYNMLISQRVQRTCKVYVYMYHHMRYWVLQQLMCEGTIFAHAYNVCVLQEYMHVTAM